jgi:hypothetical protein
MAFGADAPIANDVGFGPRYGTRAQQAGLKSWREVLLPAS